MTHVERFPHRHPLCDCPEITFANAGQSRRSPLECRGGLIAHPEPIGIDEMNAFIDRFKIESASGRVTILNRARPMPRAIGVDARARTGPAVSADESWYRVIRPTNASGRSGTAELYIYDEIGYFGVSAQSLINELRDLDADTIQLHLNSPGGEVYDGIAIYNALLNHPARVVGTVDALAASAASFIAQACDELVMSRNAEMMIHDAIGVAWDNAAGLRELADRLDSVSDNIAGIYADRAGGTVASWREVMQAETWYSADEAVAAGLADRVAAPQRRGADDAENRWRDRRDAISARFRYANRGATRAPRADFNPDQARDDRGRWTDGMPVDIVSTAVRTIGGSVDVAMQNGRGPTISAGGRTAQLDRATLRSLNSQIGNAKYEISSHAGSDGVYRVSRFDSDGQPVAVVSLRPDPSAGYLDDDGNLHPTLADVPAGSEGFVAEYDMVLNESETADFGDEPATRVSLANLESIHATADTVTAARRVDAGNSTVDTFPVGRKRVGLRTRAHQDGAEPREVTLNATDVRRLDDAINAVIYGDDDDQGNVEHLSSRSIETSAGAVQVTFAGSVERGSFSEGSQLTITPGEGDWQVDATDQGIDRFTDAFADAGGAAEILNASAGGVIRAGQIPIVGEHGPEPLVIPAGAPVLDWRTALDVGVGATAFIAPDVFHAAVSLAANNAPAPPTPGPSIATRGAGIRTDAYEGVNLNDLLREAVTG